MSRILCNGDKTMTKQPQELVWLYAKGSSDKEKIFTPLEESMHLQGVKCRFLEGYPDELLKSNKLFTSDKDQLKVLVIDDLWQKVANLESLQDIFTIHSHHSNIQVFLLCQNLYGATQSHRHVIQNLIRNSSYIIIFADRRSISTVKQIANFYYPGETYRLVKPFLNLIKSSSYDYIVIDLLNKNEHFMIRQNGLIGDDAYCFIFTSQ